MVLEESKRKLYPTLSRGGGRSHRRQKLTEGCPPLNLLRGQDSEGGETCPSHYPSAQAVT